jgi:hypothetical protein
VRIPFAIALLAAVAVPSLARAETIGIRLGVEAPLYTHNKTNGQSTSFSIGDTFQPAFNGLLSYKPDPVLAFEAEFIEGFASSGGSSYNRTGTAIGPGLRIQPTGVPLYVRASLPIHVEPSPVQLGLRGAAGLEVSFVVVSLYLEGGVTTSLVGGSATSTVNGNTVSGNVGAFDITSVFAGTGLWFKF